MPRQLKIVQTVVLGCGLALCGPQVARAATTLKCTAKGKTISQVIAALKPATGYTEIDISGNCTDNIYIPPNQAILLVAANGTTLAPANANAPTIDVEGRVIIENLAMTAGNFNAVYVYRGGYATLLGGKIAGMGNGVQVSDNSGAVIEDTTIVVSGIGVSLYAGANVEIDGAAGVFGQNATTITSSSQGSGVNCNSGSITFNTDGGGSIVLTGNADQGIYEEGCKLSVFASTANPVTIEKTGTAGQFSAGLQMQGGRATLSGLQIINNLDVGLSASEGASVEAEGIVITGNAAQALYVSQNSVVHIVPYYGINTISSPSSTTQPLFNCYQDGRIYVDQIAGTITPAPTSANTGCLTVGGP